MGSGEGSTMRNFIVCTVHLIWPGWLNLEDWAGHVARMEEGRSAFKILTGKPTGKRPLGSPRRRWEDNIRIWEIGLIRFRIGLIGEPLWMRHWTSGSHKPWLLYEDNFKLLFLVMNYVIRFYQNTILSLNVNVKGELVIIHFRKWWRILFWKLLNLPYKECYSENR